MKDAVYSLENYAFSRNPVLMFIKGAALHAAGFGKALHALS